MYFVRQWWLIFLLLGLASSEDDKEECYTINGVPVDKNGKPKEEK